MIRKTLYFTLAAVVVFGLGTAAAAACDGGAMCNVKRTVEKTETGIKCTIIAQGDTTAEQVRTCIREHKADHADNVTVGFEDVDGGIVVIQTGADEAAVSALHAKADNCAGGKSCARDADSGNTCCNRHHHCAKAADDCQGCCKKGHGAKAADGSTCPHRHGKAAGNAGDCPRAKKCAGDA